MGRINTEKYMEKLKSVLDEKSTPQRNLWTCSYFVVDNAIYTIMFDYIRNIYGSYYSDELPALFDEHKKLFRACLNTLGIK